MIITPSVYSKKFLDNYQLKPEIKVISNGIDLPFWQARPEEIRNFKARYQANPDRPLVISVRLPIKRKGILDFVDLAKRLPDYDFVWFGQADVKLLPKEVQRVFRKKMTNLSFPGYIDRDDIRIAYAACDIYLFLTHGETEGIVLLEALASKAKTIVRDIPVFESDFTHGENVYKGRTVEDFEALINDLSSGELEDLAEAGYQAAAAKSIKVVGQKLQETYAEALAINKVGRASYE